MTKGKKVAAVAVRDDLSKALSLIDERLAVFTKLESANFKTNGEFRWNPNYTANDAINIHKTVDLMLLLSIFTSLRTKHEDYEASVKQIQLEEYPIYTWQGQPWENWEFDLKVRIAVVSKETAISKLKEQKSILEKHLTKDEQLGRTLKELGFK